MLVDPVILRAFGREVGEASQSVTDADLAGKVQRSLDGLPGSAAQWVAQRAGDLMKTPLKTFSDGISAMGDAVRGSADTYEVTDEDLAGKFRGIQVEDPAAGTHR